MNKKFIKRFKKAEFEKEKELREIASKRHAIVVHSFNNLPRGTVIRRPASVYRALKDYRNSVTLRTFT